MLDGYGSPEEMLERAKEIGLKAYAITEHGNQYSWVYFDKLKEKYSEIKIIYGVELYETFDTSVKDSTDKRFHLIALARNEQGRIALNKIITKSNLENFYYKPRVQISDIIPYAKDLIITSACLASKIARESDYQLCVKYIRDYKSAFPFFFLEMQSHNTSDQKKYNQKVLRLSKDTNTPYIITTDSHAATKEDLYFQARHVQTAHDSETMSESYEGCYLQSEEEIHNVMDSQIGYEAVCKGLEVTNEIADYCEEVKMPFQDAQLPTYPLPDGFGSNYDYLKHLIEQGWVERGFNKMPKDKQVEYKKRIDYELDVINKMKFPGYFVIVRDFINHARGCGVKIGAGRGCFLPTDKVLLADGMEKPISEIQIGDVVINHNGSTNRVLDIYKYEVDEDLYCVKGKGKQLTTSTNSHEYYVKRCSRCDNNSYKNTWCKENCRRHGKCDYEKSHNIGFVRADELKVGDMVGYPKPKLPDQTKFEIDLADYVDVKRCYLTECEIAPYQGNNTILIGNRIHRYIQVNQDLAYLCGVFIGDGWTKTAGYEVGIAFHSNESKKQESMQRCINILKNTFGLTCTIVPSKIRNLVQIKVYSSILWHFMRNEFGINTYNKHIPNWLITNNKILTKSLLLGLMASDGSYSDNRMHFDSVNRNLITQVQMLWASIGIFGNIKTRHHDESHPTWKTSYKWTASGKQLLKIKKDFPLVPIDSNRKWTRQDYDEDDDCFYTTIEDISTTHYKGLVYDLSVENVHSYVVNGNSVHNSGAGSLICFTIGITNLNPMKYGLIFERFLNPERVSMPDLDVDVSNRATVIDYLIGKYNESRVCQIINFSYITPTVAIKDVGKVLGFKYNEMDKLSKKFSYDTFNECIEHNREFVDNHPEYAELFSIAKKLSGRIKTVSAHAGGVGIVDTAITDYMAMKLGTKGEHIISVDKRVIEEIGIIKFDILGVQTLSLVQEIQEDLGLSDWNLDINNPEFENDTSPFELLKTTKTNGVFQVESAGMKDLLGRLQVSNMEELSAVLALYRPDSMPALEEFIACKHDNSLVHYIHEDMKPILESTYGCMIYQEQLLDIVRTFGGRSYGGADLFRKAIAKKNKELVKQESTKLYQEIIDNGYSEEIAKTISDDLASKGSYLFNKSHSYSYAVLCFQTAYLKANYPVYFFKALFNLNKNKAGALNKYILDAKDFNVEVLAPNINRSEMNFSVVDNKVLFGLSAISGIGENVAAEIIEERRANGKFTGFQNLLDRVHLTKAQIVSLIKAGAIPTKDKRKCLISYLKSQYSPLTFTPASKLPTYNNLIVKYNFDIEQYRIDDKKYDYDKERLLVDYNKYKREQFDKEQQVRFQKFIDENKKYLVDEPFWEFQALQIFINNNPFVEAYEHIQTQFNDIEEGEKCVVVGVISRVQKKKDRNKNQFAFINIYSSFGLIEGTVWHSTYKQFEELIYKGSQIAIVGKKLGEENIAVEQMKSYDQWLKDRKLRLGKK